MDLRLSPAEAPPRIASWLRAEGAAEDVAHWAERFGDDWGALWSSCPRPDWMLAIGARVNVEPARLAEAAWRVSVLSLDVMPDGENADPIGDPAARSDEELATIAATLEARSDAASDPAVATALLAQAQAARTRLEPSAGAMAAALTTQALVLDAGDCAMMSVVGWSHESGADRVRAVIDAELVAVAAARLDA
jgi:hypothetical protein